MNAQARATVDLMMLMIATLSGMAVAVLAVLLGGGGHGWVAARFSAAAIILAPAGAIAWCYRERRVMHTVAGVVTVMNIVIDVAIVVSSDAKDIRLALEYYAPVVIIWAVLWLMWQVVAASAIRSAKAALPIPRS